jgi:hypothetical protein
MPIAALAATHRRARRRSCPHWTHACASVRGVKPFDSYLFVLPDGDGGHGTTPTTSAPSRVLQGWQGWLLGCRDRRMTTQTPGGRCS